VLRRVRRFLLHIWHPSYYPCHKHGSKSWMSKGENKTGFLRIFFGTFIEVKWTYMSYIMFFPCFSDKIDYLNFPIVNFRFVLASCVICCGVDLWLDQSNDYKIGIYCLSAEHDELRRKGKDWLAWIRNNVYSENGFPYVLIFLNNFQQSQCFMRSYFVCIKYKFKYRLIFSRSPQRLKTNNVMVNGYLVRAPEG
jgi:hypothetical protein